MYRKGHYGVSLLVFSPVEFVLVALSHADLALVVGGSMLWLSMLPDVDHLLPGVPHRGPTHSLAFAALVGGALAVVGLGLEATAAEITAGTGAIDLASVAAGLSLAAFGFGIGALSVLAHLLGDVLTPMGVNFLWPFSSRRYTLGLWRADNTVANYGLFAAGIFAAGASAYLGVAI